MNKRILSLLMSLVLLLGAAPACAELIDTPTGAVAESFSFMQYAALHIMFDTDEELWDYAMSQGPYESEGTVRYATHDYRYNVAFMPNASGTGVEEIHILSDASLVSYGSVTNTCNMARSVMMIHLALDGNEDATVDFEKALIEQLVDVSLHSYASAPYQSARTEILDGVYMSCYRNGETYAILIEFDTPVTDDSLFLYKYAAYAVIKDLE